MKTTRTDDPSRNGREMVSERLAERWPLAERWSSRNGRPRAEEPSTVPTTRSFRTESPSLHARGRAHTHTYTPLDDADDALVLDRVSVFTFARERTHMHTLTMRTTRSFWTESEESPFALMVQDCAGGGTGGLGGGGGRGCEGMAAGLHGKSEEVCVWGCGL